MALSGMGNPIPEHPCLREIQGRALLPGRRNCEMKKRFLSLLCVLALCLGLLPVTALAAEEIKLFIGGQQITESGCYEKNQDGDWTKVEDSDGTEPANGQFYYDAATFTLTLNQAEITHDQTVTVAEGYNYQGSVIAFSQTADVSLKIVVSQGTSTITGAGGIRVDSKTGNASLSIKGSGSLDVEPKGSNSGITLCSSKNTNLDIDGADVTASSPSQYGVYLLSDTATSTSTITVNNGSLTTGGNGNVGIYYYWFGDIGTSSLTVSGNAVVDTRNSQIMAQNKETAVQVGAGSDGNGGIVFNGKSGTVYGDVTLQEDLEIGTDETLTIPGGSSLNANDNLTNNGTINVEDGGTVSGSLNDGTTLTTPSISQQPQSTTVTEGSTAEFSITASDAQTYQWQRKATDTGSEWEDISDATTASYTTAGTTTNMSGYQYRCVVTGSGGVGVISSAATLTVETYTPPTTYTIRVDVTPAGAGSVSGGGSYTEGTSVTLTATANPGYRFTSWTSVGGGTFANSSSANTTFTMPSGDVTVTANFVQVYTVTVSSTAGGTATADKTTAAEGDTVTLTATPDSGYHFDGWNIVSGTVTIQNNQFTMPAGNVEIQAIFDRNSSGGSSDPTYSITLPSRVTGGELKLSRRYAEKGETVTLTAIPDEGYELDTLTVTDSKGNEIDLTHKGGNEYTFKMPAGRVEIEVSFREIEVELPFTDVPEGAWYADAAAYVYEHGLMAGTSATTFAPDVTTSRAMIATILWRMAGSPVVNYAMDYTDVAQNQWCSEAIRWATSEGVVTGYGNGQFGTNDPITREQFAVMLYRFAQEQGYDVSIGENTNILSYTDVADLSEYAISAMQWAVGAGIINGTGDGSTLTPQGQATRAQAAVMLMRFCEEYVTW